MKKPTKLDCAREALAAIERVYLRAAGFVNVSGDTWTPPQAHGPFGSRRYRHYFYRTGHAINALKFWDGSNRQVAVPCAEK